MKGSNTSRVLRLAGYLARHPLHIWPYLRIGPFCGRGPLDLGLPWLSLSSINFLDDFVTDTMSVFEYGAGGSTIYFAKRAASVTSTEDKMAWLERVRQRAAELSLNNIELQHRAFDFHSAKGFAQSDYLHSIPDRRFDIILIDGTEESTQVRPACFKHAESRIKEGGIIVVDDSWRYTSLRTDNRAKSWREFRSIGPCRPGVTSTDIFFY